jgi:hypothetical protein
MDSVFCTASKTGIPALNAWLKKIAIMPDGDS